MAIRTVADCKPVPQSELEGSRGGDGNGVILPTVGYKNPGPTENLRGVEPNTGKQSDAGNSYPLPKQDGSLTAEDESWMGDDPHGEV